MGNPLSKGPVHHDGEERSEELFGTQLETTGTVFGSRINNQEPPQYNHRLTLLRSLNCAPLTVTSKLDQRQRGFPNSGISCGVQGDDGTTTRDINVLDFIPDKHKSGIPIAFGPHHRNNSNILKNKTVEINLFPTGYPLISSNDNQSGFITSSIKENDLGKTFNDRIFEINFSTPERSSHQPNSNSANDTENNCNSQRISIVSKFFENGPKMQKKIKETKSAKRRREAEEVAEAGRGRDSDEEVENEQSEVDKQNFSDWEALENPFIQSYLEEDSDGDSGKKIKVKQSQQKIKMKSSKEIGEDTDEESPLEFKDDIERPKITQVYKPGMKKGRKKTDSSIFEPQRGKGSFGLFEAHVEERKLRKVNSIGQRDQRAKPDFQIMDPGDGEDEWGTGRMLEPPPETVVVTTVPYGYKKVVAEDGTITYTQPDPIYEKSTMTNLGIVTCESMNEEEIEEHLREVKAREEQRLKKKKEKEERRLLNLPEPEEDEEDEENTDYLHRISEESEDYDANWEEFENSKAVSTHPVYGIPTKYNPYGHNLVEDEYLSDADENNRINTRPTDKKDLKILGDVVQALSIENPDEDDEPFDLFEDLKTKPISEEFYVNNTTTQNEEKVDKIYDDDYNDGIQDGVESNDEYNDDVADVDLVLKYSDGELITYEKPDFITDGLLKVELKRNAEECNQGFELVLEDEDNNYEDDQVKDDFEDGLNYVKPLKNADASPSPSFVKMNIDNDSDEDIDATDESESYDSEEDDYEDNVKEEDYNDGIRLSEMKDSQSHSDEEMDSDEEFDQIIEGDSLRQQILNIQKETDHIDPQYFEGPSEQQYNQNEDESDGGSDVAEGSEDDEEDDELDDDDLWDDSNVVISSTESSDYDPERASQYGDLPSIESEEEEIEQDYNPTDLVQEFELQGDTFDDFEYSLDNATWIDFPYKHAGDAVETSYDRGEPGRELPYWYFIKHPAEDDSLMNIRAKLADQYDIQFGPYNPFKVNPPPKPFWVDDRFDLVPEGVQVPDDFYPGFMKPDPETLRQMEEEEEDDDEMDDNYYEEEDVDGRSWRQLDNGEISRRRTWKSWRSRPEDDPARPVDDRRNDGFRDVDPPQTQRVPKKNDQWQHYRDWLLRQGSKSVAKNSEASKNTNNSEHLKSHVSVPEGRFSGKKITLRTEEKAQPRPHYQTWLSKQASVIADTTTNFTEDNKANKPHDDFKDAFLGDRRSEVKQRPSENMWQHYQKWKQKDITQTRKTNSIPEENVDYFVFSKPPLDNNSEGPPYSKEVVDVPKNNDSDLSTNELSGLDLMRKSHNMDEHIFSKEPSPKRINDTIDNSSTISDKSSSFDVLQKNIQSKTTHGSNKWDPRHNAHNNTEPAPSYSSLVSPQPGNPGLETPATSMPHNNAGLDGNFTPNMLNNLTPSYSTEKMFSISYETEMSSLTKNKSLKRSSYRTSALMGTPRYIQPKLKQSRAFEKIQPLQSPIHIVQLDNNLNPKATEKLGKTDNCTIDISGPHEVLRNIAYLSSVTSRNSIDSLKPLKVQEKNASTERVINQSNVDVNKKNTLENENKITTTDEVKTKRKYTKRKQNANTMENENKITANTMENENKITATDKIKPKRKYTKRKQSVSNGSNENPETELSSRNSLAKRKYTRRAKISPEASNVATLIKSDDSSFDLFNQTNKEITQTHPQALSNSVTKQPEPHVPSSSGTMSGAINSNDATHYFETNESLSGNATETKFVQIVEKNESKNYATERNVNYNSVTSFSSSKEEGALFTPEAVNTPAVITNTLTVDSNYKTAAENKPNTLNKDLAKNHWQHYQTFVERQVNENPIVVNRSPTSIYISTPSPPAVDPSKTLQPTPFASKIYPFIQPKQHGDHWLHYTTWLKNNGITTQLYKTPFSRAAISTALSSSINDRPLMPTDLKVEPKQETFERNFKITVNTVGETVANHITDKNVKYLHQRWLAWQNNLASKMVNKLNKMLKYYENPEGNITQSTVKVQNMIMQRDYWREIHRWSTRNGFSLYNKTPPQTHPATLNLIEPVNRPLRPQWPGKGEPLVDSEYSSEKSLKPKVLENYKHWSAPDPEMLRAQPPTPTTEPSTEQREFIKGQDEIKRPKFPDGASIRGYQEPVEGTNRPKFPDLDSIRRYQEPVEVSKRPRFPDLGSIRSYQEPKESLKKPKFPDLGSTRSYQEPEESSKKTKFPDYGSFENYLEPREGKKRPQLPDQVISKDYQNRSAITPKRQVKYGRSQKSIAQEQSMIYGEKNQDSFFKEISDLLGQNVQIEEKVKASKSKSMKHLQRRQKAKYQEEKKERIFKKKNSEFLIKMEQYDLDTSSDDEEKTDD